MGVEGDHFFLGAFCLGGDIFFQGGRAKTLGGTSEFFTAKFSHFLMTNFFDFLRPVLQENSPTFSVSDGLKSWGARKTICLSK